MAWIQSDLDAIEAAIASGELTVQFQDQRVTYRSIGELVQARELIRRDLEAAASTTPPVPKQVRLVEKDKGFN